MNISEAIRSLVNAKPETNGVKTFEFVKNRKAILKLLIAGKHSQNIVGVYSQVLGDGMFLTSVVDIEPTPDGEVIVFNRYDITGKILTRNSLELEEIQMVCPFEVPYRNPVLTGVKV